MKKSLLTLAAFSCLALTSASAATYSYTVTFTNETTPVSEGTGSGTAVYDDTARTLQLDAIFSGLNGTTSVSHIHASTTSPLTGTAGVATTTPSFSGFPSGLKAGSFSLLLDLSLTTSYNPSYLNAKGGTTLGAEAALTSAMASGNAYWNIHSSTNPGGEIRGFFVAVPEPSSLALLSLGALGALTVVRRKKVA